MPDWAIHLAAGAGAGKIFRLNNLHVLLLGAILPDAAGVAGSIADCQWLQPDSAFIVNLIVATGSPFGATCLSLILACWMTRPLAAFGLMLLGALSHYLLDVFQAGHVEFLLYPYSFDAISLASFIYSRPLFQWISLGALLMLVIIRLLPLKRDIRFSPEHGWLCFLPAAFLAAAIFTNTPRLPDENKFNLEFLLGRSIPENSAVCIYSGKVIQSHPLTVKKFQREIEVVWPETISPGKLVYVHGRYANNKISADSVILLATGRKMALSLLAALILVIYWITIPPLDKRKE